MHVTVTPTGRAASDTLLGREVGPETSSIFERQRKYGGLEIRRHRAGHLRLRRLGDMIFTVTTDTDELRTEAARIIRQRSVVQVEPEHGEQLAQARRQDQVDPEVNRSYG